MAHYLGKKEKKEKKEKKSHQGHDGDVTQQKKGFYPFSLELSEENR